MGSAALACERKQSRRIAEVPHVFRAMLVPSLLSKPQRFSVVGRRTLAFALDRCQFRFISPKSLVYALVAEASERFKLPAQTPLVFCYEAGRDGFYPYRRLTEAGHAVWVDRKSVV
mgnify:CR=1 FL=1